MEHSAAEFKHIYRTHHRAVYEIAGRLVGATLADDVTQEVFVGLWKLPERFDPERGQLGSLLARMAHDKSVDLVRQEVARQKREHGESSGPAPVDVEWPIMQHENAEHLARLMLALPDTQREAIDATFFGGYTYRDAATFLGLPEGTLKSRIRTGLTALHRGLTQRDAINATPATPGARGQLAPVSPGVASLN